MSETATHFSGNGTPAVPRARGFVIGPSMRCMGISSLLEVLDCLNPESAACVWLGERGRVAQLVGVIGADREVVVVRPGHAKADGAQGSAVLGCEPRALHDRHTARVEKNHQEDLYPQPTVLW